MAKIESGRWSELLRRALNMKGQEQVASELSPEISPTWQLEGPTAEWAFLKSVRLAGGAQDIVNVIGNRSILRLRNPAGSGVIGVVDFISYSAELTSIALLRFGQITVDLPGITAVTARDQRWEPGGVLSTTLRMSFANGGEVPSGRILWRERTLANVGISYNQPIVLTPGTNLDLSATTLNITLDVTFVWKERRLLDVER